MKRLFVLVVLLAFLSCNKDKFKTQPQISIKSYNTKEVDQGQRLQITIAYTDKEGDLAEGNFFAVRERMNVEPLPSGYDKGDTLNYPIASFPKTPSAELALELDHIWLKEHPSMNDTIRFRIAVVDEAGNKSDTITTDNIAIIR